MAREPIRGDFGVEFPLTVVPPKTRGRSRVWYKPNHRSFGAFMRSEQMRDVTEDVARDIAAAASSGTPAAKADAETHTGLHGRVKAGFKVERESGLMKVGGNLRVRVDVVNEEPGAALVEFGSRGVSRQRMLGRAGAAFGDFKPEGGPE